MRKMNYPAASSGVSKSQRLGEFQAQQAAGNMTPREIQNSGLFLQPQRHDSPGARFFGDQVQPVVNCKNVIY